VVGIAPYVADALADLRPRRMEFMSETALVQVPPPIVRPVRDGVLRILFVGRIIRTKGVRDLIGSLRHLGDLPLAVDVVGDGPDRSACQDLATAIGVSDRVTFHGRMPHDKVWGFYQRADVFAFPSYREPGGNAVFEAMGCSLPLIVCDRGGPAQAVDDSCAIRLPVSTPAQLETDLASAIRALASDPARRLAMGAAARNRLLQIGVWDSKIAWAEQLYDDLRTARATAGAG
jgi:glycosyltransferase involved in cell wall biosynthesis